MYTVIITKKNFKNNVNACGTMIFNKIRIVVSYANIKVNIICNHPDFYVDDNGDITIIKCDINVIRREGNTLEDFKTLLSEGDLQVLNSEGTFLSEEEILDLKFSINKQDSTTHCFAITDIQRLGSVKVESQNKVSAQYKNGNNVTKIGTISNNFL